MPVYHIINEDPNMNTRFRVKEEYKNLLLKDSNLRWKVIGEISEDVFWGPNGYGQDWQDSSECSDVSHGFELVMVDTIIDTGKHELYSELASPPQNIKVYPNQYFEVEYLG